MIPGIIHQRLFNQQLLDPQFTHAAELVKWIGAMQAQDYTMCKWAVGVRTPGSTDKLIENEIGSGKIIRTHVLRPTWHLVHIDDIRWMIELTAERINKKAGTMNRQLELDDKIFKKSNKILYGLLRNGEQLTREEIMKVFEKKGIATNDIRGAHLMFRAELDMIVCNGARRGKQFTYTLFDCRIPPSKKIKKNEALAKLALKYFSAHGPATLQDFTWWSGLSLTESKLALEFVKPDLISEKKEDSIYWYREHPKNLKTAKGIIHFLPAFDEWIIGYAERSHSLALEFSRKTILSNGIFKAVILLDGIVIGLWRKVDKNKTVFIEVEWLGNNNSIKKKLLINKTEEISKFLETDLQLLIS